MNINRRIRSINRELLSIKCRPAINAARRTWITFASVIGAYWVIKAAVHLF
jgi:hypothetical protein